MSTYCGLSGLFFFQCLVHFFSDTPLIVHVPPPCEWSSEEGFGREYPREMQVTPYLHEILRVDRPSLEGIPSLMVPEITPFQRFAEQ